MKDWNLEADVVVVGSGGGALTAAIAAHDQGAKPVVLERSDKVGGTTSVSGGGLWVPLNAHMKDVGIEDTREEALAYCKYITSGRADDILVETFVDRASEMLAYVESNTPVKFTAMTMPDYHPEEEGAKMGGRSIEAAIFSSNELGEWKDRVRPNAVPFMSAVGVEELFNTYQSNLRPANIPVDLMMDRMDKGLVLQGNALIGALLKGCLDRKIPIHLDTRALELIRERGRVTGLRATKQEKDYLVKARGGVVLACGGFEWNEDLKTKYLQGIITHPHSPPFNEGDGIIMAAELGADLANMHEVWWMPSTAVPGEEYEGRIFSHLCFCERTSPHSILVNRFGQRFANESANYNDMPKAFFIPNENGVGYRNLPCWGIYDSQYRENYLLITLAPGDPDPEWLYKDETLEGLAGHIEVDAKGLSNTVKRFNGFAQEGKDLDFGRGDSAYDQYIGDKDAPHPNLGTLEKPPFYAIPVYPGALGTKGGPRADKEAQVLDVRERIIPGLYAAGNVMAGVSGPGYYGGGGTIAPAMTWGYIAGINAAKRASSQ